jgi:pimeloyl-ACP methyl ester carboxylesterase
MVSCFMGQRHGAISITDRAPDLFFEVNDMRKSIAGVILLLVFSATTSAETLVLLQGYLGDEDYWRETGITHLLAQNGWVDAGTLRGTPYGIRVDRPPPRSNRRFYTVALPSEAPLMMQLRYLESYLDVIHQLYQNESLLLAGHSAGGVLGRLYMVTHPDKPVGALITFVSPHLGTGSAEIGAMAGNSPLGWVAPLIGGSTLNRSQSLYYDLVRARPGSLLFWLNHQEHPSSLYISIVRDDDGLLNLGDLVVPAWSQDMNQVAALRGRARKILTQGGHGLSRQDGELLVQVLRSITQI